MSHEPAICPACGRDHGNREPHRPDCPAPDVLPEQLAKLPIEGGTLHMTPEMLARYHAGDPELTAAVDGWIEFCRRPPT